MGDFPRNPESLPQDAKCKEEVDRMLPDSCDIIVDTLPDPNVYVITNNEGSNGKKSVDHCVPGCSSGVLHPDTPGATAESVGKDDIRVCFSEPHISRASGNRLSLSEIQVAEEGNNGKGSGMGPMDTGDQEEDAVPVGCADSFLQRDFHNVALQMAQSAEEFVRHVWMRGWQVVHHHSLPSWLKDNDFLVRGHRPELKSFRACFKSIFRVHTETGNIWTHLLAFVAFIGIALYFLTRPSIEIQWQEKAVFSAFFLGAILCLGFSWLFHTVYCHSQKVGLLFNKLDYCGIALLTMGSFVPWLYYSFYCRFAFKVIYLCLIVLLGTTSIIISMFDKFAAPQYRPLRAGVFISLGLSGVIPCIHFIILEGFYHAIEKASLGWFVLMAFLYISGAVIYAVRIPERIFPGRFDLWFQSHQIFHVFVVAAAFVHFHGISEIANYRLTSGDCYAPLPLY